MDFRILGPVQVVADGCPLELGGRLERALLGRLLVSLGRPVAVDRLIEDLWDGEPPDSAGISLRVRVSRLRKVLSAAGCRAEIATRSPGYAISLAPADSLDAVRFTELTARGRDALRAGDPQAAAGHLADALAQWRGAALADVADVPYARTEAARLDEERLAALEDRIEADLALGRHGELVGELDAHVAAHPFRERLWAQRMLALYRSGRQGDALAAFQALRRKLGDELGIDPSPQLCALEARILHQDPELVPGIRETLGPALSIVPARAPLPEPLAAALAAPFVGRDRERTLLVNLWNEVRSGTLRTALVSGEPGIGKTSLAARIAREVFDDGATVLYGRCEEVSWAPYQPFVEALRQHVDPMPPSRRSRIPGVEHLARIIPEVGTPSSDRLVADDPEVARYRFFEAVSGLLADATLTGPLLLVVDDVHWADHPTLALLRHVLRTRTRSPILVIGTYREADLTRVRPFADTVADLRRERAFAHIPLRGLNEEEVIAVLEHAAQHDVGRRGRALAAALAATTEGNPFFIDQILGHLVETGRVTRDEGRWVLGRRIEDLGIPEGVREAVGRRLSRLSDTCNRALAAASVLGRSFEIDVLTRMTGSDPDDLLTALEEALRAGLVREQASGGRAALFFSHVLVQQAVLEELPLARRQRLHLKAASAIEAVYAQNPEPHVARLARHLGAAGTGADPGRVLDFSERAMVAARRVFAFEEALGYGETALEVMDEHGGDPVRRARLLERIGDLRYLTADFDRGIANLRESLAVLSSDDDPLRAARIHIKLGHALASHWEVMDIPMAFAHLRAAQDLLGPSPADALSGPLAVAFTQAGLYALDVETVETWSNRAMEIGRAGGNEAVWSVAAVYHALWRVWRGGLDEARADIEQAWQVADRIDHFRAGFAASWGSSSWSFRNDPREDLRLLRREADQPRQAQAAGHRMTLLVRARGALARAGDLDGARRLLDDAPGVDRYEDACFAMYEGAWEAASGLFEEAIANHRRSGGVIYLGVYLVELGHLYTVMERPQEARVALWEAVRAVGGALLSQELLARARLAILEACSGHAEEAATHLARCEEILTCGDGWSGHLTLTGLARGSVAAAMGRRADAERAFAETIDACHRFCFPWDEAETLHHWGRALLAAGDRERGVERLDAALHVYRRMHAGQAWIDQVLRDRRHADGL